MATLLLAFVLQVPPAPSSADVNVPRGLEGRWSLAAGRANGQDLPEAARGKIRMFVFGDEMVIHNADGRHSRFVITVGAKSSPNAIDFAGIDGMDKGKQLLGIHELKGDQLKVCRTLNAKVERPKGYAAEAGSKCVIEEWRREKEDYTVAEDLLRLSGRWNLADPKSADSKVRLKHLDFASPMLSVTFEERDNKLGFESAPWRIDGDGAARKVLGPSVPFTYKFAKGLLQIDFAEGRFQGSWTLKRTRGL